MSKKESEYIKINDDNTMSAIIEMLLSDAHIAIRSLTGNARFIFSQSGKPEKLEYFNLVLEIILPFCPVGYKVYIKEWYDRKLDSQYTSISLTTMQLPCFTKLINLWYLNKIKIIPVNIKSLLSPITLAHWIMGDGSYQNGGLHLSVYAFSISDVTLLRTALE